MVTRASVYRQLDAVIRVHGNQARAAKALGISRGHLCRVVKGEKEMGAGLLKALGYKRCVMYEQI